MRHRATPDFWYHYRQLPQDIQELADQCYELLKQEFRSQNPGVRISWLGFESPSNCGHRVDGGDLNPLLIRQSHRIQFC
ncbi:MAG: hypothetical protein ACREPR_17935 [Brasilonema sp.]